MPTRDPIGTEATLNGATAEGLRAFYRRWYRPERATVILVGDADPAMLEELVRARFGGWQGEGPNPRRPRFRPPRRARLAGRGARLSRRSGDRDGDLGPAL